MYTSTRARPDLIELSEQLNCLGRTRSRTDLAVTLIGILRQTLGLDRVLVVLLGPDDRRVSVFGGSPEERRLIGRSLGAGSSRAGSGMADLASTLGRGVRVVPIRDSRQNRGLVLIGGEEETVRTDDLEYVRFLAERTAEVLPRHSVYA